MGFTITKGEDLKIEGLIVLLYGDPSTGKTSSGLTASKPVCFDFDGGAHRSYMKSGKDIIRIKSWNDINESKDMDKTFQQFDTIIIDTVETCLDYIRVFIEDKDYKLKTNKLQMYGRLKDEFYGFLNRITKLGKDVVMIAHATTDEQNGIVKTMPKITGGSKDIVRQKADFIGYMFISNNKRVLNFNPTDYYEGKNSAGFPLLELPDYLSSPDYFGLKLDEMKSALRVASSKQDEALNIINDFTEKINKVTEPEGLHLLMTEMSSNGMKPIIKKQIWEKMKAHASSIGFKYNDKDKKFFIPVPETVPAVQTPVLNKEPYENITGENEPPDNFKFD